jgi:hypothetical protein
MTYLLAIVTGKSRDKQKAFPEENWLQAIKKA